MDRPNHKTFAFFGRDNVNDFNIITEVTDQI